jgi:hypothetical protein
VIKWTKDYYIEQYSSYGPMPFQIERIVFDKRAEYDTLGKFAHVSSLTIGKRVLIRSINNPELTSEIELFQTGVIPACFGAYEYVNLGEGQCTVVLIRWKKG